MSATTPDLPDLTPCHLCGHAPLSAIKGYEKLHRVSSDCKPLPPGGKLRVCPACGGVQKAIDETWGREVAAIYKAYDIYHQSGGVEQAVFAAGGGDAAPRSRRLLEKIFAAVPIGRTGRLLDVGCGNGALLQAFAELRPDWRLTGTELDDKYRRRIEAIPGVERLHVGPPGDAIGTFDLASMIHVLEHVPHPQAFIKSLKKKLAPGGKLLVEVPDHRTNPFDLVIADHSTHFSIPVLAAVLAGAGFKAVRIADDFVPKELTALAQPGDGEAETPPAADPLAGVRERVRWLAATADWARAAVSADHGDVGIFGTSIGATFLSAEVAGGHAFFVDEDPARAGRSHLGKPTLHPRDVPPGSRVLLALPPAIAAAVGGRLTRGGVEYLLPPAMV